MDLEYARTALEEAVNCLQLNVMNFAPLPIATLGAILSLLHR